MTGLVVPAGIVRRLTTFAVHRTVRRLRNQMEDL